MFGYKERRIKNLEVDLASAVRQRDGWYNDSASANHKLDEANRKLVVEIESRIASEDATNILASVLCDLVRKKRSKKKG